MLVHMDVQGQSLKTN